MSGFGTLLRLRLRRDRTSWIAWTLGLAALVGFSVAGVAHEFDDAARRGLIALMNANPALLFMRGGPIGTGLGAMVSATLGAYISVLAALMGTFLGVRHTRGDEDSGLSESEGLGAFPRRLPVLATLAVGLIETTTAGAAVAALLLITGLPAEGSLLTGASAALLGTASTALGVLAGQALPTSRSANGAASAVVGLFFAVRGVGDALGTPTADLTRLEPAWQVWASPIGWAEQVRPFASDGWSERPGPLLLLAGLALVLAGAAALVEGRREAGASLVPERRGRPNGSAALGTPFGLLFRLQRGALLGWAVTALLLGQFVGRIAPQVADSVKDNPTIGQIFRRMGQGGSGAGAAPDYITLMLTAIGGVIGTLACAAALQAVQRLGAEERTRGETLLAGARPRAAWAAAAGLVGLLCGAAVLAAFSVSAGASLAASGHGRWEEVRQFALGFGPVLAVYTAAGLVLLGLLPGTLGWLGWVLLLGLMLGGEFAPLLGDGFEWLSRVSPFHWVPQPSDPSPDWGPSLWMLGGAAAGAALGIAAFGRRDARV